MVYVSLYKFLPELAMKETRTITVLDCTHNIPAGEYGLLELYCADVDCDCRRVLLTVLSRASNASVAVIAYGWEDLKFYAKWYYMSEDVKGLSEDDLSQLAEIKGPCLNTASPQSKYAPEILKLVAEHTLSDKTYVDRLQQHYKMFKK